MVNATSERLYIEEVNNTRFEIAKKWDIERELFLFFFPVYICLNEDMEFYLSTKTALGLYDTFVLTNDDSFSFLENLV